MGLNFLYKKNQFYKIKLANTYVDDYYDYHCVNWDKLWTLYRKWMSIKGSNEKCILIWLHI